MKNPLLLFLLTTLLILTEAIYSQTPELLLIRDEIYVRFSEQVSLDSQGVPDLNQPVQALFAATPILQIRPVFPAQKEQQRLPGMERVFRIQVQNANRLEETLRKLNTSSLIVYAEPIPVRLMFELPNDPLWFSQYHMALMKVDSARDIFQGDSSVAIAIIDGGVNYLHEDLHADIWVNAAEDVDGDGFLSPADLDSIDADGNGFVDDVIGWDFVNLPGQGFPGEDDSLADNEPMDFGGHGTHCAGDAAAVTDNGVGIASVGGDSRIMCIRAGMVAQNGFGYIYYSVEGIYYAANNGAKIISMSYGSSTPSSTEQFAIDYAFNQGVICVAAAGNDNTNQPQYPANYNHVIAVAATDQQDHKADFSSYGAWVDVSAPGVQIQSTTIGGYGQMSGTSMSTPIVAGLAGLTAGMFPQYSVNQVVDRIIAGCDSIDHLNPNFAGLLGAGRVNAFKTLDKVIRLLNVTVIDSVSGNNNGILDYGETAQLVLTLKNTYANVTGLTIRAKSLSPIFSLTDSIVSLGNLALGDTISNSNLPFSLQVGLDTSFALGQLQIQVTADGGYSYQKIVTLPIGQREILVVNDDQTTGASKIGYYREALDSLHREYDVWDVFTQGTPGTAMLNYQVIIWYTGEAVQNILTAAERQFLQSYLNSGGCLFLTGQNIGYDLVEQQNDTTFFKNYLHANYLRNSSNDYSLAGVPGDPIGAGQTFIILGSGGANNQNSPDVITAITPAQASIVYEPSLPDEQAAITYAGAYRLVYFAFGWEGINDFGPAKRQEVMERVLNWLSTPTNISAPGAVSQTKRFAVFPNYPNPFNPQTIIHFSLPKSERVILDIFNSLGQRVRHLANKQFTAGEHKVTWNGRDNSGKSCSSGVYYYQLKTNRFSKAGKMVLLR